MSWATEESTTGEPGTTTGRVLGVDLGSRRIGIAVSDDSRQVASALMVLTRGESHVSDHGRLTDVIIETGASLVVVGLPLSLSGGAGPAARAVLDEVSELRAALDVPVECCDERYSTVIARRALAAGGRRPIAGAPWWTKWRRRPSCRRGSTAARLALAAGRSGRPLFVSQGEPGGPVASALSPNEPRLRCPASRPSWRKRPTRRAFTW